MSGGQEKNLKHSNLKLRISKSSRDAGRDILFQLWCDLKSLAIRDTQLIKNIKRRISQATTEK